MRIFQQIYYNPSISVSSSLEDFIIESKFSVSNLIYLLLGFICVVAVISLLIYAIYQIIGYLNK